jgi:hypothetical protein
MTMPIAGHWRIPETALARQKAAQRSKGGLRIIGYFFASDQQIWLMTLYDKNRPDPQRRRYKKQLQSN